MAVDVIWLDEAKNDLLNILDFIATRNPRAALQYVAAITEACHRLADFPLSGRQYDANYRFLVVRNHLVFYRFDNVGQKVAIATVIDGRRDIEMLLADLLKRKDEANY